MRLTLVLALLVPPLSFSPSAGADDTSDPAIDYEKYTLDNGLEVILHRDNSAPLVAVSVWYHVASGNETHGKSGFAHLFEHMLFQGSKNVGADRHFAVLKEIGASAVNGSTNKERTNYFEVIPSHQLETALWLESDRMGYLLPLLTQHSLDNQIEVVRNERRQNYDTRPYGKTRFAVHAALYPEGHPYRFLTIGKHEDLASASLDDVKRFYRHWYVPANATLAIAGDFETAEAKRLIAKWFGSFPKSKKPTRQKPPTPVLDRDTRTSVIDDFASLRRLDFLYHSPAFYAEGDAEMDYVASALGRSGTGRLYKTLVHETQLAQTVSVRQRSQGFSSFFVISVTAKPNADLAVIENHVDAAITKILKEGISKREYDRAFAGIEADFVWNLESLLARAETLQSYNHFLGNPDSISFDLDRYRHSSLAKVKQIANQVLGAHRAVVVTMPGNQGVSK